MLTDTQREYLETPKEQRMGEYTKQQRSYHSQNIRERVRAGILDFRILMDRLEPEERYKIYSWHESEEQEKQPIVYQNGVRNALAFLYLSQHEHGIPFERILQWALDRAWREIGGSNLNVEVSLDIEVEEVDYLDPQKVAERARAEGLESLSEDEAAMLLDYADAEGLLNGVLDELADPQEE